MGKGGVAGLHKLGTEWCGDGLATGTGLAHLIRVPVEAIAISFGSGWSLSQTPMINGGPTAKDQFRISSGLKPGVGIGELALVVHTTPLDPGARQEITKLCCQLLGTSNFAPWEVRNDLGQRVSQPEDGTQRAKSLG